MQPDSPAHLDKWNIIDEVKELVLKFTVRSAQLQSNLPLFLIIEQLDALFTLLWYFRLPTDLSKEACIYEGTD